MPSNLISRLFAGVRTGDWAEVGSARTGLARLMVEAADARAEEQLRAIQAALAKAHALSIVLHDIDPIEGAAAHAWQMKAEARGVELQREMRPPSPALEPDDVDLTDAVFRYLANTQRLRPSNSEIADGMGGELKRPMRADVLSRVLKRMRADGWVEARKVGRTVQNQLTLRGWDEARRRGFGRPSASVDAPNKSTPAELAHRYEHTRLGKVESAFRPTDRTAHLRLRVEPPLNVHPALAIDAASAPIRWIASPLEVANMASRLPVSEPGSSEPRLSEMIAPLRLDLSKGANAAAERLSRIQEMH